MSQRKQFDVFDSPLAAGRTLIEASAGTGKTYTIAGLFLRLILEQGLGVQEILVTTYTELATAELRDRIRRLLRETLDGFLAGDSTNELVSQLIQRHGSVPGVRGRLRLALETFDDAAIYTIHGFCQRMLKDRAFESGSLFDAEMVVDQTPLLREIVEDFWRSQFYSGDALLAAAALQNGMTPQALLRDLDDLVSKPTLRVIPPLAAELSALRKLVQREWARARTCWLAKSQEVRQLFEKNSWAKQPYNLESLVAGHLGELDRIWLATSEKKERSPSIAFFTKTAIGKGTRSRHSAPAHEMFDCCEELVVAEKQLVLCLRAEFFSWARAEMKRRKTQRNIVSFDDLLTRLNDSLLGERGTALAASIRQKYRAALVDEFQDTDPVQYSIFEHIYADSDSTVFFIGDPKQAIYGFRGADVFTYLRAAKTADFIYTLPNNWRSETGMVEGVNSLFGLRPDAFVLEGISFRPVVAAGRIDRTPLTLDGAKSQPLQLWLARSESPIGNNEADESLPTIVAGEIVRLLSSVARIGSRRVVPADIAVLVSTNNEAQLVQDSLLDRNVPAVVYSAANVFQSPEARELVVILTAVVQPTHEARVRAALATEALGLTSEELDGLSRDELGWERRALQFQGYYEIWRNEGFIQMFRRLLLEQRVRPRFLRLPDGERRLTNMLHLAELLHEMCAESQLGMTGLLKRLAESIANAKILTSEEYEVRLERDEKAVRIVTVHKSKGLEYNVVFCPFSWENPRIRRDGNVIVHQNAGLVLDLERSENNQALQLRERLADKVRLLYVALTRARHRAYLVWGNFGKGQESALAHLVGSWSECGAGAVSSFPSVGLTDLPEAGDESYQLDKEVSFDLEARTFNRDLDRSYGIASFTGLITGQSKEPETPEYDAVEVLEAEPNEPEVETVLSGIFAFPRGTAPGTSLHHILEQVNFQDRKNVRQIVEQKLQSFSIPGFEEVVTDLVEKVCTVPLRSGGDEFKLEMVAPRARFTEWEFYFPLDNVTQKQLVILLGDDRLHFRKMSGFMKGFIDLVVEHNERFYIVDWKSNWLGSNIECYSESAMAAEMKSKFYSLQLGIYTVALHRFLASRLAHYSYERHFGGAYYIFLRGVDPARPEYGIYRSRLNRRFVDKLSGVLS